MKNTTFITYAIQIFRHFSFEVYDMFKAFTEFVQIYHSCDRIIKKKCNYF